MIKQFITNLLKEIFSDELKKFKESIGNHLGTIYGLLIGNLLISVGIFILIIRLS